MAVGLFRFLDSMNENLSWHLLERSKNILKLSEITQILKEQISASNLNLTLPGEKDSDTILTEMT